MIRWILGIILVIVLILAIVFIFRRFNSGSDDVAETGVPTEVANNGEDSSQAPNVVGDIFATSAGQPVSGNVLSNDTDPQNDPLTVDTTPTNGPTNGTLQLNADGSFVYTPSAGYVGVDSFDYRVCDPDGNCAIGMAQITINSAEDSGSAGGDSGTGSGQPVDSDSTGTDGGSGGDAANTDSSTDSTGSDTGSTDSGNTSSTDSSTDTSTDSSTGSTTDTSTDSSTGSTTDTSTDSSTGSTTDTSTDSSTGSTTDTSTDSSTGSTTDSSTDSSTGSTTDTSTDSSTGSTTDSSTDSSTGSTTDSSTDSSTGSTTDSGSTTNSGGGATNPPSNTTGQPITDPATHVVKQGEWLIQIARCYGTSPETIRSQNYIPYPGWIMPGESLTISGIGSVSDAFLEPCIMTHTVQQGDTLYSIAQTYQVDLDMLLKANYGCYGYGYYYYPPVPTPYEETTGTVAPTDGSEGSESGYVHPGYGYGAHSPYIYNGCYFPSSYNPVIYVGQVLIIPVNLENADMRLTPTPTE